MIELNEIREWLVFLIDLGILIVLLVEYRYDQNVYDKVLVKIATRSKRGNRGKKQKEETKEITIGPVGQ